MAADMVVVVAAVVVVAVAMVVGGRGGCGCSCTLVGSCTAVLFPPVRLFSVAWIFLPA